MTAIALDIESTGSNFLEGFDSPFALYGCDDQGKKFKWEWSINPETRLCNSDKKITKDILSVTNRYDTLVFHNGKFDLLGLESIGVHLPWRGRYFDTLLASHVLDNIESHKLKDLSEKYIGRPKSEEMDLKDAVKKARRIARKCFPSWNLAGDLASGKDKDETKIVLDYWLPKQIRLASAEAPEEWLTLCDKYGYGDVIRTMELYFLFSEGLKVENLKFVFDREIKLLEDSLYDMQKIGVTLNHKKLDSQLIEYKKLRCDKDLKLKQISDINYMSPIELPRFLFGTPQRIDGDKSETLVKSLSTGATKSFSSLDKFESYDPIVSSSEGSLGLPVIKNTKCNFSTDKFVISELLSRDSTKDNAREYLQALSDYKQVDKAIAQLENIKQRASSELIPGRRKIVKKVFCWFNQTGTKTTRFSCSNPNTQNISKGKEFEDEHGDSQTKYKIRSAFGPRKGRVWYCIDYSQLQLRIFSSPPVCNEVEFYDALNDGYDGHTFVGCKIYDRTPKTLTTLERRTGKNVNFGFIFGASPKKINMTAGIDGLWDTVMSMFPSAHAFMTKTKRQVRQQGHVYTPWGYRLKVNQSHKGVNYIVQGAEGDIVKNAMIGVSNYLKSSDILVDSKGYIDPGEAYLSFQVHDELIFDFPVQVNGSHRQPLSVIKKLMEDAGKDMGIITPVDIEVVTSDKDWSLPRGYDDTTRDT